jgi:hypothetical protein
MQNAPEGKPVAFTARPTGFENEEITHSSKNLLISATQEQS